MPCVVRARVLLALVVLPLLGCQERVTPERPAAFGKVQELWQGGGLCARVPEGIACASSEESTITGAARVVSGLGQVKDIAMTMSRACALDERGVACFRPGDDRSERFAFESPTQVLTYRAFAAVPCVLHAKGVSCFKEGAKQPTLFMALGTPRRLLFDEGTEHLLCGVEADLVRCITLSWDRAEPGVVLRGLADPKAIFVNKIGGQVHAVDGERLTYGEFAGTLLVGDPHTAKDPLDVDVTVRPFKGADVKLAHVAEVGGVKAAVPFSNAVVVLTDKGLAKVERRSGAHSVQPWATRSVPSDLMAGAYGEIFTVENGKLHVHGQNHGKEYDREVTGAGRPKRVFHDTWWSCFLGEDGTVGCTKAPPL